MESQEVINSKVKHLWDAIEGKDGMKKDVILLNSSVQNLNTTMEKTATALSGIHKFMAESKGSSKEKTNNKNDIKWIIAIVVTIGLSFLSHYILD